MSKAGLGKARETFWKVDPEELGEEAKEAYWQLYDRLYYPSIAKKSKVANTKENTPAICGTVIGRILQKCKDFLKKDLTLGKLD